MYGHGAPPPTRSAGTVITQRVLISLAGFFSCGLLACVPLFRVAFLRGRWFDWLAAWASLPLAITCFAIVGALDEDDSRGDATLAAVLLLGALASAYYLVVDIRLNARTREFTGGYGTPQASTVTVGASQAPTVTPGRTGYGTPPPATPYPPARPPMPPTPGAQGMPGAYGTPAHPPTPAPSPQPARLDQVRAELDEISDYLRRHDGNSEGSR
ncbi:hypothetical protein ACIO13_22495 [Streptomyces sp. NPDC087425]|uniref:hypothetical protein n=1 Tax=Streptomyces sp. NPDC087425 TaxID=3365787 RepID=UPI00380C1DC0